MTEPATEPSEDELTRILEPWDWEDFECKDNGHRELGHTDVGPGIYNFYLRVGIFLKRPVRVIMAAGKYVRMKEEIEFKEFQSYLKVLNPATPETALYEINDFLYGKPLIMKVWRPCISQTQGLQGLVGAYNQIPPYTTPNYGGIGQGGYSYTISGGAGVAGSNWLNQAQQYAANQQSNPQYNQLNGPSLGYAPSLPRVK